MFRTEVVSRRLATIGLAAALAVTMPQRELSAAESAAGPSEKESAEVERLYAEGVALYQSGRYQASVEKFREAYRVYQDPKLLFNIGRALQAAGDLDGAIESYQRCAEHPRVAADVRDKANQRVAVLRSAKLNSQLAPMEDTGESPLAPGSPSRSQVGRGRDQATGAAESSSGGALSILKWVGGGVAAALLVGGTWSMLSGMGDHGELDDAIGTAGTGLASLTRVEAEDLRSDGLRGKRIGAGLLIGGAAMAAGTAVLFILDADRDPAPVSFSVEAGTRGAALVVGGSF